MKLFSLALIVSAALAGCGGGSDTPAQPVALSTAAITAAASLQGTWVYSSDNRPTGSSCGLTPSGGYGERITLIFANGAYTSKLETCLILIGNTGGYVPTESGSGTYVAGEQYLESSSSTQNMYALDLQLSPTYYTAYNVTNGQLRLGAITSGRDGSTTDKRAYLPGSSLDPVYTKQ